MNPIAVTLFYSTQSSSITFQNTWISLLVFKFKYENLGISTIGLNLYFFLSVFLSTKVNPMPIPIHQDHRDTTLTQYHAYLNLVDLVHIINIQFGHLSKVFYVPINVVSESYGVDTLHTTYSYSMLSNRTLNYFPISFLHIQPHVHLILLSYIELFNLQMS
jgi:hypothetical protein